jgi:hypothetical protein
MALIENFLIIQLYNHSASPLYHIRLVSFFGLENLRIINNCKRSPLPALLIGRSVFESSIIKLLAILGQSLLGQLLELASVEIACRGLVPLSHRNAFG